MSRVRQPSQTFLAANAARLSSQMQAAAMVATASNTAAALDVVEVVAGDVAAIDAGGINDTLADYGARIAALETP